MRQLFIGGILLSLFSFSSAFSGDFCWWDCNRVVETSYGKVKGKNHGPTNSWYAIPYAGNAKGDNRWKPPQPVKPWKGTLNASSSMQGCEQWASPTGVFFSDEDCLNLTVFAPDKEGSFPVMFWIFGGGFLLGSGNESSYKGSDLAKNHDVVVVTINHRLGPLGFLSHPALTSEQGRSGNYGFLDQVAALQWVNDEIAAFGGDPTNITVFGESAGGASVCMLMASPLSRDLFQKGIISSGPCGEWETLTQEEADAKGVQFAISMGCEQADPAAQLACLRNLSPRKIRKKLDAPFNELFKVDGTEWKYFPNFTKDDYFIDANFEDMIAKNKQLIEAGELTPQAVIQGTVKDEGSLFEALKDHPANDEYAAYLKQRFSYMSAQDLQWVLDHYPIDQFDNVGHAMSVIMGDQSIVCPGVKTAEHLTDAGYPVYQYQFTEYSDSILRMITKLQLGENPPPLGVFHSGEIGFLFGHSAPTSSLKTDDQKFVSAQLQQYMVSLANTANPNKDGLPNWPIYTKADKTYLIWGDDFTLKKDLRGEFCPWWIEKDFFGDNF
ncbi:MAG: carboxylesterase family protein [Cellvibrionales bacterium]|nr:carboxylesterase family protein [Cellvibrionales bacterium]